MHTFVKSMKIVSIYCNKEPKNAHKEPVLYLPLAVVCYGVAQKYDQTS